MFQVLFTSDYEIHGNGEGCPRELMVEPTQRMMDLFEEYGAKLTIMADVAEILRFKQYAEETGEDKFHARKIECQLRAAVRRGHDVQLHLHASYFNARFQDGRWEQDWSEYNFAALPVERVTAVVRQGKEYLESLLHPVMPGYQCNVFRAANWAMSPSENVIEGLVRNGFTIDTSVFKYGVRKGLVGFDYSNAPSDLVPWLADARDICRADPNGSLCEIPIYCERRPIGAFLCLNRIYRAWLSRKHKLRSPATSSGLKNSGGGVMRKVRELMRKHPWKADFNQCSGRQLIGALKRAEARYGAYSYDLPFVLIGHSKLFNRNNERSLRPFLSFVSDHPDRYQFALFRELHLPQVSPVQVDTF